MSQVRSQHSAYVHLAYGLNATRYREKYLAGLVPDVVPYGFHHAESAGWRVSYSEDHPESMFLCFIRRILIRILGFDFVHAYRNRNNIRASDIVWTMEEIEYLAVCALPYFIPSMPRPRLIAQTVWLFDRWEHYSRLRQWLLRKLLKKADELTIHSREYLELVPTLLSGLKPQLLHFGISLDSFPLTKPLISSNCPIRLLSIGNDPSRDWDTLIQAFGNDNRFELKIVCNWLAESTIRKYTNIGCPRNPTMDGFRELYRWADIVVITTKPNRYSGITVALEATSMGVPVIASATGGIPTYFNPDEVLYIPTQDAIQLREAVFALSKDRKKLLVTKAQQRFSDEDYSTEGMVKRYIDLSQKILSSTRSE